MDVSMSVSVLFILFWETLAEKSLGKKSLTSSEAAYILLFFSPEIVIVSALLS